MDDEIVFLYGRMDFSAGYEFDACDREKALVVQDQTK
jgi:hypothetical protein